MAITPPSDIVLDVARAADPERYRAAAERLARLRSGADTLPPPAVRDRDLAAARQANADAVTAANLSPQASSTPGQIRRRSDAYGQFESFVLQSFIQSMLPKNAVNVFGKGSAGEFWRSMLAEKMGDELARSGQVGIASRLAAGATHPTRPANSITAAPPLPPPSLLSMVPYIQQQPADTAPSADPAAGANLAIAERS